MCTVPQLFPEGIGKKQKGKESLFSAREEEQTAHTRDGGKKRRKEKEERRRKKMDFVCLAGLAAVPSAAQKGKTSEQTIAKIVSI